MEAAARDLYARHLGRRPTVTEPVAADGSARRMVRLRDDAGGSAVAVLGPDPRENAAFLAFTEALRSVDLPVPAILAAEGPEGVYLVEDLGDETLFDRLRATPREEGGRLAAPLLDLYRRILELLVRFQIDGGRVVPFRLAWPVSTFDGRAMRWDAGLFKHHFLMLAGVPFDEARLHDDVERLIDRCLDAPARHFLYRDLQSRNIMLRGDAPAFIDYQGGRRGALPYDVASLLWDAKADLAPEDRDVLLDHYLDVLTTRTPVDRVSFRELTRAFVLLRSLQALGTYGRRGIHERKAHFLARIPYRIRDLARTLETEGFPVSLPELEDVIRRLAADPGLAVGTPPAEGAATLRVRIVSFSYRRGLPVDEGGHGGGFVFDSRALPNPGREARFAERTGRDPDVVAELERHASVHAFFEASRVLVHGQVRAYLERGFTSLAVAYGCTGGQHRSVYLAERLGRRLRTAFPSIVVTVEHEEHPDAAASAAG